jgi:peptidoglycan/xylan/chitin deacetylase (PgdA/CDA1 family)
MTALMYHDVVEAADADASGFPGRDAALYKVTPEQFDAHLTAIAAHLRGSGTAEAVPCDDGPPPAFSAPPDRPAPPDLPDLPGPVITFDDGGVSAMRAADTLERHGFIGHFFVTVDYIGTRGFLAGNGIRALRARGHLIGSHSCSHPLRMGHCSRSQLLEEWTRSRALLTDILGEDVRVASVPGGDFAPRVATTAAAAGITQLFTSEPVRRPHRAFGLTLHGRYTIRRWTTAKTAAALANGAWLPCARQAIVWNGKKITKRVGGEGYLQIRKLLLGHGNEVQWGDHR